MSLYVYTSPFADAIESFLEFKASVGIMSRTRDWTLYDFDRWCVRVGAEDFDKETVEGWVKQRKEHCSSVHLSWMSHIRELGRYMQANGYENAYVLSHDFKSKMTRVIPYLLS